MMFMKNISWWHKEGSPLNNNFSSIKEFVVLEDEGIRLDQFVSTNLPDVSRNYIQKLIDEKRILVNGKYEKKSFLLKSFDSIEISIP